MTTGRLIRRTSLGLLLLLVVVIAGACKVIGPTDFGDLRVATDNAGPKEVSVTVTDSGPGMTSNGVTPVAPGGNLEVVVPLAATWEARSTARTSSARAIGPTLRSRHPANGRTC